MPGCVREVFLNGVLKDSFDFVIRAGEDMHTLLEQRAGDGYMEAVGVDDVGAMDCLQKSRWHLNEFLMGTVRTDFSARPR